MISFDPKLIWRINLMNLNEVKKDLNTEDKKKQIKSKLEVLTNENDFLIKNIKKAGWSTRALNIFQTINYLNCLPKTK